MQAAIPEKRRHRIPIFTAMVALFCSAFGQVGLAQQGPAPVVVAPVVERKIAAEQELIGTVVPLRTSVVGSAVDGRVIEFLVNEGDPVQQGQPLAQLLTGTLEIEIAMARAELDLREQELAELENGSRPGEIEAAHARMQAADARSKYAVAKLDRTESLFRQSRAATEDELQLARADKLHAEQNHREAMASYELVKAGPRQEKIDQAKARMKMQQEQVRHLEDRLEKHTIRAPFDGYVTSEGTEVGQWIQSAEVVAEVIELDPAEVLVNLPETAAVYVALGMPARVELDALPGQTFSGEVARLVPKADYRSRTFPVKVRVENPLQNGVHVLKAGMLARVRMATGGQRQAMMVPKDALVLGGASPTVYVVDAASQGSRQGKVRQVPVESGIAEGNLIQVSGALQPGQRVVIKGNERLKQGQEVRVLD